MVLAHLHPWELGWDALVAIGTFVLAFVALLSALKAGEIDRKNAERQARREALSERAIARMIWAELNGARLAVKKSLEEGDWPLWQGVRCTSWERSGYALASALDEHLFEELGVVYDALWQWQDRVDRSRAERPTAVTGFVPVIPLNFSPEASRQARKALEDLDALLPPCLTNLHRFAFSTEEQLISSGPLKGFYARLRSR